MITIKNLNKTFALNKKQLKETPSLQTTIKALDDIFLECKPGRILTLLGPNGAGKSTLLRILATIIKADSGDILINNINVQKHPQNIRKQIGFLTGTTQLYDKLSVNELIDYFGQLYHLSPHSLKENKNKWFDILDIHSFANKKIGTLSVGMKQRVSIARSLIHNPEVIIFDEPTSGLDVISAESVINIIHQLKNENKTILFSSHIMSEVDILADDLAIINKGKIIFNDTFEAYKNLSGNNSLTQTFIQIIKKDNLNV